MRHIISLFLVSLAIVLLPLTVRGDVFNMPAGDASLQFVNVGDPGNVADATGYGAVGYTYQMGKYDVTLAQYTQFLNAVAATDTYGLYSTAMGNGYFSDRFLISRSGSSGSWTYAVVGTATGTDNIPVPFVTWGDAARFCNWLDNGQGTASTVVQAFALTETGAYNLSGATTNAALMAVASPSHNGSVAAKYFIPSEDEWYKASYYKSGGTSAGYWSYPTQSNTEPINTQPDTGNHANFYDAYGTGNHGYTDVANYLTPVGTFSLSPGPYGTFDQGGDLFQWNETNISNSSRVFRGGSFDYYTFPSHPLASNYRSASNPTAQFEYVGFRIASSVVVPEPGSLGLSIAAVVGLWWRRRRR
jgi:formylglycine-generating enzyme required for sulfatase activity